MNMIALPALSDNYIWLMVHLPSRQVLCVDPGQSEPLIAILTREQWQLHTILLTHHHDDHTGGVSALSAMYQPTIFAPAGIDVPFTHLCQDNDIINLGVFGKFHVMATPGHTKDHIVYHHEQDMLFTGDTLFSAGCGRLFEGTSEQMYNSLKKIKALPTTTRLYCAHEYTLDNLRFARMVEPHNQDIITHQRQVKRLREQKQPSLPSTLATEKKINPFLRCETSTVKSAVEQFYQRPLTSPVEVFHHLRNWKNAY